MPKLIRRINTDDALIILILLIGTLLRFYRLDEVPFTYDEFSALFRTQFDTFSELIRDGVKIDTHPAGIQVFLFYWVKLFGIDEFNIKLPFVLFGLLSVWLIYRIGSIWFNSTVGLIAASFISFLQYTVMYSQIARPYSSGLCFALLMVLFWTRVIFQPHLRPIINLSGYVISGALCTYNHHFSLLFAFMVGITGLFYCSRLNIKKYLIINLLIIILYIPHLSVFFTQLNMGGIEDWLQKPRYDFILTYLQYIFHFSVYEYLLVFVLLGLGIKWYSKLPKTDMKFLVISMIWFLCPYLIGFFYSRYVNSVLQYSVLIFSYPFLLFAIFGWFKTVKPLHQVVIVFLIAIVTIPSLVGERKHYQLFYHSPYLEMVKESKKTVDSLGITNCTVILDTKRNINQYYIDKLNLPTLLFTYADSIGKRGKLLTLLDSCQGQYLVYGCISDTPWENYSLMIEKFPYLIQHKTFCGGDYYLFSRIKPAKVISEYFYETINTFEPSLPEWGWVNEKLCIDSLTLEGKKSFFSEAGLEFSPTYSMSLRDLMHSENDVIDISVDMRTPIIFPGAWLVVSVTANGKDIKWISAAVGEYVKPGHQGRIFQSLRLSDIEMRHHGLMLKAFIWNPMKLPYVMDNFRVRVRSGNPMIYGLFRKI